MWRRAPRSESSPGPRQTDPRHGHITRSGTEARKCSAEHFQPDPGRRGAEVGEGPDVAVDERLLGLVGVDVVIALPDAESRMTNIHAEVSTPSMKKLTEPKSTSASCRAGGSGAPSPRRRRSGTAFGRGHVVAHVDPEICAPCSSTRRCQMRRAVWRCFFGAATSPASQLSIIGFQDPRAGAGRSLCLRAGGR